MNDIERLSVETVSNGLALASNSDSHLVLLVAASPAMLRDAALREAASLSWRRVDLNRDLTRKLLPRTFQERQEAVWDDLGDAVGEHRQGVVVLGTDVLFEPSLGLRPFEALRWLGRQGPLLATWCGAIESGALVRASPGHPEYQRVKLNVPYVDIGAARR